MLLAICTLAICATIYFCTRPKGPPKPKYRLAKLQDGNGATWWEVQNYSFGSYSMVSEDFEPFLYMNTKSFKAVFSRMKDEQVAKESFANMLATIEQADKAKQVTVLSTEP